MKEQLLTNPTAEATFQKVSTMKKHGGDYASVFHAELLKNNFTATDVWSLTYALGYEDEKIVEALIKSKQLNQTEVFFLLKFCKFPVRSCETAYNFYEEEVFWNRLLIGAYKKNMKTYRRLLYLRRNQMGSC